jgi:hypothetical protein
MAKKAAAGKTPAKKAAKAAPKAAPKAAVKKAATPRAPKPAAAERVSNGEPRRSKFTGLRLFSSAEENPRRKNSAGFKSHEIVLKNPGIRYEEFLKKGGRAKDFAYDTAHGFLRTERE